MRLTLAKIAVLLHVALLVIYLSWARGGSSPALYLPLLLLVPGLTEMVLMFPPRRRQETAEQARARVRRQLMRDPILYLGFGLLLFVGVQVLNGPCRLVFNDLTEAWTFAPPPFPGLPFCVNRGEAGQAFFWFATALAAVLAVRHGLSRRAKVLLLDVLSLSRALLSLLGLLQYATAAEGMFWVIPLPARFFATFSYPNQAAAFFSLMFLVSGGLLIAA